MEKRRKCLVPWTIQDKNSEIYDVKSNITARLLSLDRKLGKERDVKKKETNDKKKRRKKETINK